MANDRHNRPIGVFDSGIGGLTVVRELIKQLPGEDIVYFGDTARVPYGTKSKSLIIRFSKENTQVLLRHHVKMVVVACNSSSSHALTSLRKSFSIPIVGVIHPGAKQAKALTKNGRVGVIATTATINSGAYERELLKLSPRMKVFSKACPLFVPLVEEGWTNHAVTREVAKEYLGQMKKFKGDTLILGCTHYPLLKGVLQKVLGPKVALVDSAQSVAAEVRQLLQEKNLSRKKKRKAKYLFLISDESRHFRTQASRFLNFDISKDIRVHHV